MARARMGALLRIAFKFGAMIFNNHVVEHFAIMNNRGNRTGLAELEKFKVVKFTLDLRAASDTCSHRWAYPPTVSTFPATPRPHWPRLDTYINRGGLINANVL